MIKQIYGGHIMTSLKERPGKECVDYVDKTMFIADLLYNWGEVNLFTRPRRFGKSLNMSMLKAFFEIDCDRTSAESEQLVN